MSGDGKVDLLDFKLKLNVPQERTITSLVLILILDFQLKVMYLLKSFIHLFKIL